MSDQEESFTTEPIQRAPRKLDRESFERIKKLHAKQQWLEKKQDEFWALDEICQNLDEQNLIVNLLYNFCYLTSSQYEDCLKSMAHHILHEWGFESHNTQVIACDHSDEADSSKKVLQDLKSYLNDIGDGWDEINFRTTMETAAKRIDEFPNVILVDEFMGTGDTLVKRLNWFNTKMAKAGKSPVVRVCVVASMEAAKDTISGGLNLKDYFSSKWLKKGISDCYQGVELEKAKELMSRLESELQYGYYPFGYKQSEALYSMEAGIPPEFRGITE